MPSYVPCEGYKLAPVNVRYYPSTSTGLGYTQAKTFADCAKCGYTVLETGDTSETIKMRRHKPRI